MKRNKIFNALMIWSFIGTVLGLLTSIIVVMSRPSVDYLDCDCPDNPPQDVSRETIRT